MNFSKDHIIRYLKGDLPHHEQYILEKMMLEDPFLSDAIEGLQNIQDPEKVSETINEIEDLIIEKYGKAKTISLPIYRNPIAIAAAISLFVLSAAIILITPDLKQKLQSFLVTGSEKEQFEQVQKEEGENKDLISMSGEDSVIIASEDSSTLSPIESSIQEDEQVSGDIVDANFDEQFAAGEQREELNLQMPEVEEDIALAMDETDIPQDLPDPAQDTLQEFIAETQITEVSGQGETQTLQTLRREDIPAEPAAKRSITAAESEEDQGSEIPLVSGEVISATDNQPLAGVNVLIKGTSKGTITDNSGSYQMEMPTDQIELEFYYIGFQSSDINVTEPGTYNVSMQTSANQFSEFIFLDNGNGEVRIEGSDRFASPDLSKSEYIGYLRNNLIYPDAANENNVRGQVVVEFKVSTDGSISNAMVVRSLGFGCDEEALRLLSEGPAWKPAIRNGSVVQETVRVSLYFSP